MKRRSALILIAVSIVMVGAWLLHLQSNPLRKYGVSFENNDGGWGAFDHLQLYRSINGQKRKGPEISGSSLNFSFKDFDGDKVPEILVTSRGREGYFTIIRLNIIPEDRPDFEIVESRMHLINYPALGLGWP